MKKVADHANIFALNEGIPSYLIPINTFLWPDAVVDTAFSKSKWMDQDK